MHDLNPEERLAKHRAVAAWLEYQLQQTRQTIAELEKKAVAWERMQEAAYRERRFTIEPARTDEGLDRLHRGGCQNQPPPRDFYLPEELASILGTRQVDACTTCNPLPGLRGRKTWMSEGDDWA